MHVRRCSLVPRMRPPLAAAGGCSPDRRHHALVRPRRPLLQLPSPRDVALDVEFVSASFPLLAIAFDAVRFGLRLEEHRFGELNERDVEKVDPVAGLARFRWHDRARTSVYVSTTSPGAMSMRSPLTTVYSAGLAWQAPAWSAAAEWRCARRIARQHTLIRGDESDAVA